MFAPLVAKAKSTGPQPAKALRRSLGDQASFVAPQASQIGDAPRRQTTASAGAGLRAALSWDLSKIPFILPASPSNRKRHPFIGRLASRFRRSSKLAQWMIRWSMRPIASPTR
jgi:hypothetical protein